LPFLAENVAWVNWLTTGDDGRGGVKANDESARIINNRDATE
jgi:hypothetical protein